MKRFLLLSLMFLSIGSSFASWEVEIEENLFSGGKSARILGDIKRGEMTSLISIECDSDRRLSMSYLQLDENVRLEDVTPINMRIAIKVDENNVIKTEGVTYKANDSFIGVVTGDKEFIIKFLSQLRKAKYKVMLGLDTSKGKLNFSGDVRNSTKSVSQLITACGINKLI